jgi:zinc/manganese transport system substrate-binding protein/manganese/iron transport system substrate-binding protein
MGASLEAFVESGGWRRVVRDGGVPELVIADHLDLIAVDKVIDHGDHVHDLREGDPHVWLDPAKVIEMVPVIQYSLEVSFPEQGSAIADAATTYLGLLHELNDEMEHDLGTIPVERRRLVVFHDAFTYFSARFGFEVIGVVLANSNAEPSAGELATLIETVGEACLSVAFAEPQLNRDVLELIADETGIGIGELLTDSFAGQVESYLALMRFNRDSLVRHLVTEWRDRC